MGGLYARDQTAKAADAADELVAAVDELGNATLEPAKQAGPGGDRARCPRHPGDAPQA